MSNGWSKGGGSFDFTTSSGNTCKMREVSMVDLVFDGVIDNIDTLSSIVGSNIAKKKSGRAKSDAQRGVEMMKEASEIRDALKIMDRVVIHVVLEPAVKADPEDPKDYEDDVVYISSIPIEDRTDIFMRAIKEVKQAEPFRK